MLAAYSFTAVEFNNGLVCGGNDGWREKNCASKWVDGRDRRPPSMICRMMKPALVWHCFHQSFSVAVIPMIERARDDRRHHAMEGMMMRDVRITGNIVAP